MRPTDQAGSPPGDLSTARWLLGESQAKVIPMLKGMGAMYDMLGTAGQQARQDVLRQAPPMYAIARVAVLFRPLPPLGRGVAAVGTSTLALVAAFSGIRWLAAHRG
jgi:hypothetical protein